MFYLSDSQKLKEIYSKLNLTPSTVDNMSDAEFYALAENIGYQTDIFLSEYENEFAISMYYYTYKSDDPEASLVGTNVTPDDFLYYVAPKRVADFFKQSVVLHRHDNYELLFVLDGFLYQNIENHRHYYTKGCACLMNKSVYHKEEYTDYSRVVFIKISSEYILSILHNMIVFHDMSDSIYDEMSDFFYSDNSPDNISVKSYIDFVPVDDQAAEYVTNRKIYKYVDTLSMLLRDKTAIASIKITETVVELLYTLFNKNYYATTPIKIGNDAQLQLFNEIEKFIHEKEGHVTRADLEKQFNYSGDYIYRIVLKYTGLSISDYTTQIRMYYAAQYLKTSRKTIAEITLELGFSNKTQFYNKFKEIYGMTPKEYKKSEQN